MSILFVKVFLEAPVIHVVVEIADRLKNRNRIIFFKKKYFCCPPLRILFGTGHAYISFPFLSSKKKKGEEIKAKSALSSPWWQEMFQAGHPRRTDGPRFTFPFRPFFFSKRFLPPSPTKIPKMTSPSPAHFQTTEKAIAWSVDSTVDLTWLDRICLNAPLVCLCVRSNATQSARFISLPKLLKHKLNKKCVCLFFPLQLAFGGLEIPAAAPNPPYVWRAKKKEEEDATADGDLPIDKSNLGIRQRLSRKLRVCCSSLNHRLANPGAAVSSL